MFRKHPKSRSPSELRESQQELETYHPRVLVRQQRINRENPSSTRGLKNNGSKNLEQQSSEIASDNKQSRSKWINRVGSGRFQSPRQYLRIPKLASLGSTKSSSSNELDSMNETNNQPHNLPIISITSNADAASKESMTSFTNLPVQQNDYYTRAGLSRQHRIDHTSYRDVKNNGEDTDEDEGDYNEDDDYDLFNDRHLPIPYSSSSVSRTTIVRQQTNDGKVAYPGGYPAAGAATSLEDLLDDRQGMNNSEQQFTKGEKATRPSIDGSISSETRFDSRKLKSGTFPGLSGKSSSRKDRQRRSKSPSSSSLTNSRTRRQSQRGLLFGLAARLKLTKKHESIAKLQLSILNSGFVSLKVLDKELQSFLPRERMPIKELEKRVKLMRQYQVLASIEYRFASRYETYVCRHATQESNQAKNNYKKCIPYDYNRVVLKTLPNVPDSDYINASHVDSCLKPNAYIAAQGPNENTIEDFWRMIWEQKTFVIVMLTKVFDFIRVMCNQYWPVELNKPERYGNLEVTLLYEEPLADFVIRTIKLTKLRGNPNSSQQVNESNANGQSDPSKQTGATNNGGNGELNGDSGPENGDDYDDDQSDDGTSDSDMALTFNPRLDDDEQVPTVRAPKFVSRSQRRGRSSANSPRPSREGRPSPRSGSEPPAPRRSFREVAGGLVAPQSDADQQKSNENSNLKSIAERRQQPPQHFLHPLVSAAAKFGSAGSLNGSEPTTPVTPRTPSSAGLDRSSATRKAVKKKRRVREKNTRPKRTQFMVPSESQLADNDDDEDQADANGPNTDDPASPLTPGSKSNERIIYQFHYNSWASHTCPFISSLLHFRRRVRICMDEMSKSGKTGPTVVHCNDGCGRTGTYLCIDANLELAEEDNVLDVFNYTKKIRQSRKFLIENLEQYRFVYDTIEEAMFCGRTWFPVSELHKRLKHKSQRNPVTKKNEYLREYEKITRMTSKFSIGDCAGGHRVENREKNRDVSTVPPDNFRPYLTSFQTNDSTDYINAVFVDGYTRSKEYIVTEWPLHKTISDFWSLVYDHDCNSVILLANPGESSTYPSFLPSEKELRRKFGPVFSAEMVSYTHYPNIKSWIYTINKKIVSLTEVIAGVKSEAKTTQVFQITCWPQGHRVPTSTNALVELMNMVERWRQRTTYGPVCVVSLNGKSRAGVYCAANVAIEQVVQHSEVDVFQAVKTVRRHRPQLIENMTEYKYCYDLILHYVLHYVNQSTTNA